MHKAAWYAALAIVMGTSASFAEEAPAAEQVTRQVPLWIFDARVRAVAPGIGAAIGLTDEQKQQIAKAYGDAFNVDSVVAAQQVLGSEETTVAQRQEAVAAVRNARAAFLKQCDAVFTDDQRALITKVYATYGEIYKAAQREMAAKVQFNFSQALGKLLTPEQTAAMKAKAEELKAAQEKAKAAAAKAKEAEATAPAGEGQAE